VPPESSVTKTNSYLCAFATLRETLFLPTFVVLITTALLATTSNAANSTHPNILLIVSDDQRPDTISALGNSTIRTPNLDRLVRRGTSFLNATCANPICTPSRAELLTGCTGIRNGVFDFGREIDPDLPTLPEPFRQAGYATYYTGKWHNNGRPSTHGYEFTRRLYTGGGGKWWKPQTDYRGHPITGYKGWIFRDENDQPLPELGVGLTPHISELIADGAIDAIESAAEQPFLIHLNFTAPHDPLLIPPEMMGRYRPESIPLPPNFAALHPFDHGNQGGRDEVLLPTPRTEALVKADIAAYYAVITHMDAQIGRVLDALDENGKTDSTLIVFTSDHGLAMGSHGLRGKQNMYEHTIKVPMIFAGPGIPSDQRVTGQAYLRDLFPTLCELAGLAKPGFDGNSVDGNSVDGISQVPVIRGERDDLYPFTIGYFRDTQRMIRQPPWKLIQYPRAGKTQLFHLHNDPMEQNNLAEDVQYRAVVNELSQRMDQWIEEQHRKSAAVGIHRGDR